MFETKNDIMPNSLWVLHFKVQELHWPRSHHCEQDIIESNA